MYPTSKFYGHNGFAGSARRLNNTVEVELLDGTKRTFERWAQAEQFMYAEFGATEQV